MFEEASLDFVVVKAGYDVVSLAYFQVTLVVIVKEKKQG